MKMDCHHQFDLILMDDPTSQNHSSKFHFWTCASQNPFNMQQQSKAHTTITETPTNATQKQKWNHANNKIDWNCIWTSPKGLSLHWMNWIFPTVLLLQHSVNSKLGQMRIVNFHSLIFENVSWSALSLTQFKSFCSKMSNLPILFWCFISQSHFGISDISATYFGTTMLFIASMLIWGQETNNIIAFLSLLGIPVVILSVGLGIA